MAHTCSHHSPATPLLASARGGNLQAHEHQRISESNGFDGMTVFGTLMDLVASTISSFYLLATLVDLVQRTQDDSIDHKGDLFTIGTVPLAVCAAASSVMMLGPMISHLIMNANHQPNVQRRPFPESHNCIGRFLLTKTLFREWFIGGLDWIAHNTDVSGRGLMIMGAVLHAVDPEGAIPEEAEWAIFVSLFLWGSVSAFAGNRRCRNQIYKYIALEEKIPQSSPSWLVNFNFFSETVVDFLTQWILFFAPLITTITGEKPIVPGDSNDDAIGYAGVFVGLLFSALCAVGSNYCHRILNAHNQDHEHNVDVANIPVNLSSLRALPWNQKAALVGDYLGHAFDETAGPIMDFIRDLLTHFNNSNPAYLAIAYAGVVTLSLFGAFADVRTCAKNVIARHQNGAGLFARVDDTGNGDAIPLVEMGLGHNHESFDNSIIDSQVG